MNANPSLQPILPLDVGQVYLVMYLDQRGGDQMSSFHGRYLGPRSDEHVPGSIGHDFAVVGPWRDGDLYIVQFDAAGGDSIGRPVRGAKGERAGKGAKAPTMLLWPADIVHLEPLTVPATS